MKSIFKPWVNFMLFILLCLFHTWFGVYKGWNSIVSDFPNYYVAAKVVAADKDAMILYNDSLFNEQLNKNGIFVQGQFSLYPPPTALVMLPLSGFSPIMAKNVWLIFNLVLLFFCCWIIIKILSCDFFFAANILLLTGFCLTNDLMLGQVYLLMLTMTLYGYYLLKDFNNSPGSFFLGCVMSIKYFTLVFIPVFLIQKKIKPLFYLFITFTILNLIGIYIMGYPVYAYFIDRIFLTHLQGKIIGQTAFSIQFQSFESLFNRLFVKDSLWNPAPIYESGLLVIFFKGISILLPVFATATIINKARRHPFFEEIALSSLATLLLLLEPGSATYHLLLLVFPVVLACKVFINYGQKKQIFLLIGALTAIGFLSVGLNRAAVHFNWPLLFQYNRLWLLVLFDVFLLTGFHQILKETRVIKQL